MRTFSNNPLSIPTFSIDDIKDDSIPDKSVIEKLVGNMVLVENGIYLEKIYDVKTFRGSIIERASPKAVEIESFYNRGTCDIQEMLVSMFSVKWKRKRQ